MEMTPEGEMAPRPSWWSRNWKWALPAGCLGLFSCGCLGFVVLGLGAAGAGVAAMASAGPTDEALQTALADPEVQRALGTPIKPSWQRQVSVNSLNGRTHARLAIPLDGPVADGTLEVEATQDGEQWDYRRLVVVVPGQPDIDLLDTSGGSAQPSEPPAPPPPPPPPGDPEDTDDSDINL